MQILVIDLAALLHIMPSDGVRNGGGVRWAIVQGVGDAEKIADVLMIALESRSSLAQMNLNGVRRDAHGPEQAIGEWEDPGVEIVDLCREVVEVKLTYIDIQSDKAEGVVMRLPVYADIRALHEPHIYVEEQAVGSRALDFGGANEAIEVVDRRRFLAARRKHVEWGSWENRLGYRSWRNGTVFGRDQTRRE